MPCRRLHDPQPEPLPGPFVRHEVVVEESELFDRSATSGRTSALFMRLRFWDGSLLRLEEALVIRAFAIVKVRYNYHYQRADGTQEFRYDNAPHYPDLPGFPEHKNEGEQVLSVPAPDLSQVLRETGGYPYPDKKTDHEGLTIENLAWPVASPTGNAYDNLAPFGPISILVTCSSPA